jgi:primase-polymerase (primpol)-like protein
MINNIPLELRQLPQWVVAAADKKPLNPKTGGAASVTDSATWAAFDVACAYADRHDLRVGFVLAESDPYTIIDLAVCRINGAQRSDTALALNYP